MRDAKLKFLIRKNRITNKIKKVTGRHRLAVIKSNKYVYARIIDSYSSAVLAEASTNDENIRSLSVSNISFLNKNELEKESKVKNSVPKRLYYCNSKLAFELGKVIAKKAIEKGVTKVVFDRSGYKYHGVIKSLADGARDVFSSLVQNQNNEEVSYNSFSSRKKKANDNRVGC